MSDFQGFAEPTIESFYHRALSQRLLLSENDVLVDAVIFISERARVTVNGHIYTDPYVLVQMSGGTQGACFAYPGDIVITEADALIGRPVWEIFDQASDCLKVALLDAIYAALNKTDGLRPKVREYVYGPAAEKSRLRAEVMGNLIQLKPGMRLCMIGVIEDIVRVALESGAEVRLFDHYLAGETFLGQPVLRDAVDELKMADRVLLTGNAIKTRTMATILRQCVEFRIPTVVYAMSGANLAPHYLAFGARAVTCERFPYYWYSHLESVIDVYE